MTPSSRAPRLSGLAVFALAVVVLGGTGWGWVAYSDRVDVATDRPSDPSRVEPAPSPASAPTRDPSSDQTVLFTSSFAAVPRPPDWTLGFADPAEASDLRAADGLWLDSEGASYLWTTHEGVAGGEVQYRFEGDGEDRGGVTIAVSNEEGPEPFGLSGVFTNGIHITATPTQVIVGFFEGADGLREIASIPAAADAGEQQTLRVERTGRTRMQVTVMPGGRTEEFSDPAVRTLWGGAVGVEHYQPAEWWERSTRPVITGYRVFGKALS